MEDSRAETVQVRRHTRTGGVVVRRELQVIRIVPGSGVVLFRLIERAERHVLHDVKAERLFRRDRLAGAVQFGADLVVAVGP